MSLTCYHCNLEITGTPAESVLHGGVSFSFCCAGCKIIWELITQKGLTEFYKYRDEKKRYFSIGAAKNYKIYDDPVIQKAFVTVTPTHSSAWLLIEGLVCTACVWLNEQILLKVDGIEQVTVNYQKQRAFIVWNQEKVSLSSIMEALDSYGYKTRPFEPTLAEIRVYKNNINLLLRLGYAGFAAGNVMLFYICIYAGYFSGIEEKFKGLFEWASLVISTPVVFYSALPLISSAFWLIRQRKTNMDIPISIGLLTTYFYSLYAFITHRDTYFDTLCLFVFFILTGRYLLNLIHQSSISAIDSIKTLRPNCVHFVIDRVGVDTVIKEIAEVNPGDIIKVYEGEPIPLDCRITGSKGALVDESMLTGEAKPVKKNVGEIVTGGTFLIEGDITASVLHRAGDGSMDHLINLLSKSSLSSNSLSENISLYFVCATLIISACSFLYWSFVGGKDPLLIAVSVLIITCPCAFSISIPAVHIALYPIAKSMGIIIKSMDIIEKISKVNHIVFDKTGTLTTGDMRVEKIEIFDPGFSEETLLQLLAPLEETSKHPIAAVLLKNIKKNSMTVEWTKSYPGMGVEGKVNGLNIKAGSRYFLTINNITCEKHGTQKCEDFTTVYIAVDGTLKGKITLSEENKSDLTEFAAFAKAENIKISIATGDSELPARRVAEKMNPFKIKFNALPEDKIEFIKELRKPGEVIMMAGDGFNDAPAFSIADISVAFRKVFDLPLDVADIILLKQDLLSLAALYTLSKRAMKIIRQNITISIVYNLVAIPLAVAGKVTPLLAAILMPLSSLLIILNARRVKWK